MPESIDVRRRAVRNRALGNLVLDLMAQAVRAGGRCVVEPWRDAVLLRFPGVRTLTRRHAVYRFARRDVAVAIVCPDGWPFDRAAALEPFVVEPADWAHPNSDGRGICVDLAGIVPGRLAETLHDVVRLRRMRLDNVIDAQAAAFVRSRLAELPADPRALLAPRAGGESGAAPVPVACGSGGADPALSALVRRLAVDLPRLDVRLGVLAPSLPPLDAPVVLRLAPLAGSPIDRARAAYLLRARLRAGTAAWADGPGVAVDPATTDRERLAWELIQVHRGLDALGEAAVARSYLELCPPHHPGDEGERS